MKKFKIGDKVIGNAKASRYNITTTGWRGEVTKIYDFEDLSDDIVVSDGYMHFTVESECFDLDGCDRKIVITSDGTTTLARLYDGKKVIKSAEAKCSPDDTFDFDKGAKIAFERLIGEGEAKTEEPKYKAGDRVVVTSCTCFHGYRIGERLTLKKVKFTDNRPTAWDRPRGTLKKVNGTSAKTTSSRWLRRKGNENQT